MPFQKVRVYRGEYGLWFMRCPSCNGMFESFSAWERAITYASMHADIWHTPLPISDSEANSEVE